MMYISLAPYVVQIFSDKKGLAAGLYTSCYAAAAFVWAPLASYIINRTGDVSSVFLYYGIGFFLVLAITSRFLYEPPPGFTGRAASANSPVPMAPIHDKSPVQMLTSASFWLLFMMFIFATIGGMMIFSLGSPILQGTLHYTPENAAFIVGLFAVASTAGRVLWGWISDKIGRLNVILCITGITMMSMLILANIGIESVFLIAILAVPMCYGAYLAMMAPMTVEIFGPKHFALNYNIVILSLVFAALIGPQAVSYAVKSTGGHQGAFSYGILFAAMALVFVITLRVLQYKNNKKGCSTG
jgi:OFA family oxalate/formate antiporter-like MFS transporter